MFKSKVRPIVIPQYEHLKLAGALASLWGNADFERPPIPFDSFVLGIGLHDRAYGTLDNYPIGEQTEETWLDIARRGFNTTWADPIADLLAKLHIQRLVAYGPASVRQTLAAEMEARIAAQIDQTGLPAELFARIDRVTRLCDNLSFHFCFEAPVEGSVRVFPRYDRDEETEVHYRVADGVIHVDPWPFSVSSYTGYLIGYGLNGYPQTLEPVIVPYEVRG